MDWSSITLTPENFKNFCYQHSHKHVFEFITDTEYQVYTDSGELRGTPTKWIVKFEEFFNYFTKNRWKIVGYSTSFNFHGPLQPPPSPICLKIREMEARRKCLQ